MFYTFLEERMIKKIRIIGFMFVIFASYFSVSCKFDKEETEKELESKISLTVSLPNDDGDVVILTNDKAPIKLAVSSTDTITKAVYKKRQNGSVPNANELITDENSTDISVDSETLIFYVFENGLYDIAVQNSKGICEYTSVEIKTIDKVPLPEVKNLTASCDGDYIYLSWKNPLPENKYDSPLRKIKISYEYNDNEFDSANGESFVNADEEFFSIKIADGKNKSDYIKIIIQTVDDLGNKSLGINIEMKIAYIISNNAPNLEITSPINNLIYLPKDSGLTISGSIMTEESRSVLVIYNGSEKIYEQEIKKEEFEIVKISDNEFFRYNFDINLPETVFDQDLSEQYAIKIVADNGKKTEVIKTVIYDVDAPEIVITDESPIVHGSFKISNGEYDGKTIYKTIDRSNFINGVFIVHGTIIDSYDKVENTKWEFYQDGIIVDSGIIEDINFMLQLDTAKNTYKANMDGKLVITSTDRAGNESRMERTYFVCQETDYPIIESGDPETLSFDFTSKNQLKAEVLKGNIINTKGEGQQLRFMFADDDGIDSIMISTISANGFDSYGQLQIRGDARTEYAYIYTVPTIPGYYYVTISLTDINGKKNMFGYNDTVCILVTGREYRINLSTSPEWITTLEDENSRENAKTQFTILGENICDSAFLTVLVDDENDEIGVHTITNLDKDGYITWIDLFKPAPYIFNEEKIYQEEVVYYAIGKTTGQRSTAALFRYKIDNVKPLLFNITPPNVEETMFSSFRISGFASDEGSGLSTVEVIAKNKDEGLNDNDVWQQASIGGDDSWFYTLVFSEFPSVFCQNGEKTLYARAYDVVGNCSIIYSGDFIYDSAEPEVVILDCIEKQTGIVQSDNGYFNVHQSFSLTGSVFDSYGVKDIKIEQIESNGVRTLIKTIPNSELSQNGKWTVENLPRKSDGTAQESIRLGKYIYYITVTDLVGKISSTGVSVTIDSTL